MLCLIQVVDVQVEIKEMDDNTLCLILDYIYSGEAELSTTNVQNVLSAANLFQMIALRDGCAAFMTRHITISNCIGVFFFARAHECFRLAVRARALINAEFEAVCHEVEFRTLPAEQLIVLINDDQVRFCDQVFFGFQVMCAKHRKTKFPTMDCAIVVTTDALFLAFFSEATKLSEVVALCLMVSE